MTLNGTFYSSDLYSSTPSAYNLVTMSYAIPWQVPAQPTAQNLALTFARMEFSPRGVVPEPSSSFLLGFGLFMLPAWLKFAGTRPR